MFAGKCLSMGKREYRSFQDGQAHHVYIRGKKGAVIFYSIEDCILFFTMYMTMARRYGIRTCAFCIMPNHVHSVEVAKNNEEFSNFHRHFESMFATEYNTGHGRRGQLFDRDFGYAPKIVGKKVRDTLAYVANNPVVGRLSKDVLGYRWNMLAYCQDNYPFSSPVRLASASRALRRAVKRVDFLFRNGQYLDYGIQRSLFMKLSRTEKNQMVDYILCKYNMLDYSLLERNYGTFENAIAVFDSSSGSEHDIPEDWGDYSQYPRMIGIMASSGEDMSTCNYENRSPEELGRLVRMFSNKGHSSRAIEKFLHLDRGSYVPGSQ